MSVLYYFNKPVRVSDLERIGLKFKDCREVRLAAHPFAFTNEKGHQVTTQFIDNYDEYGLIYEMMGSASIILEICDKLDRKIISYGDKERPQYDENFINLPEDIFNECTKKLRERVINEIDYSPFEPVYKLKTFGLCGDDEIVILGEEVLTGLYKPKKND